MIPAPSIKFAQRWRHDKLNLRMGELSPKVMSSKVSGIVRRVITLINTAGCIFPVALASSALAQSASDTLQHRQYIIRAAHLIDGRADSPRNNVAVLVVMKGGVIYKGSMQ
jgi:glycerol-3-phosphate O-acyltransferase